MKSPTSDKPPSYPKERLTPESVLEIFALRPVRSELDQKFIPSTALSNSVADHFNIGDRTIRDIWNRRAWASVTMPFWTRAELAADPKTSETVQGDEKVVPVKNRSQGRPRGAKDTVHRTKRSTNPSSSDPQTFIEPAASPQPGLTTFTVKNEINGQQQQALRNSLVMDWQTSPFLQQSYQTEVVRPVLFDSVLPSSSNSAWSAPFSSSLPFSSSGLQSGSSPSPQSSSASPSFPAHLLPLLSALLSNSAPSSSTQLPFSPASSSASLFTQPTQSFNANTLSSLYNQPAQAFDANSLLFNNMSSATQSSAGTPLASSCAASSLASSYASSSLSSFSSPSSSLSSFPLLSLQAAQYQTALPPASACNGNFTLLPYWAKVLGQQ